MAGMQADTLTSSRNQPCSLMKQSVTAAKAMWTERPVQPLLPPGAALRRVPVAWPQWAKTVPAYGIGTMAAFWFLQRAVSLM